jgi:hypothetical protein
MRRILLSPDELIIIRLRRCATRPQAAWHGEYFCASILATMRRVIIKLPRHSQFTQSVM